MGTKNYSSYSDLITFSRASTGTYLDSDGLLKSAAINTPRVEYDYQGNRLGLLVEEARTNLVTYSTITSANWTEYAITITDNAAVAPDGTQTAAKITSTQSGKGTCYLPGPPAGAYVDSFYAKAGTSNFFFIESPSTAPGVYFDLANGTVATITAGQTATIQDVGNGWFRCSVYATRTHANISCGFSDADNNQNQANGNYGYIWGAQVETGTFPTSYIPTSGATATRSADVATIGVGAFGYNKTAGTVLITLDSAQTADFPGAVAFNGNSGANRWYLYSSSGTWSARQFIDNVGTGTINLSAVEASAETKLALTLKGSSASAVKDGGSVVNNATFPIPPLIDEMEIGDGPGGVTSLNGHISSIAYYPRRLTDAQIKALTSPPETPTLSLTFDDSTTSYLETSIHG